MLNLVLLSKYTTVRITSHYSTAYSHSDPSSVPLPWGRINLSPFHKPLLHPEGECTTDWASRQDRAPSGNPIHFSPGSGQL